jgi:DNA-directed RNA polymerase subunit beta
VTREEPGDDAIPPSSVIEQDVFLGELPLMTANGTFIINGAERVIVSQLHKSPGVCFEEKHHPSGRQLLSARVIPYRGAWLEFEGDASDVLYMQVDRRSKLPATVILRALGYETNKDILALFYEFEEVHLTATRAEFDGRRLPHEALYGRFLAADAVDTRTGEVVAETGAVLDEVVVRSCSDHQIKDMSVVKLKVEREDVSVINTLRIDQTAKFAKERLKPGEELKKGDIRTEALIEIYRHLRPGDPATPAAAERMFVKLFFDPTRYSFAPVGRYKINRKLNLNVPQDVLTLTEEDIVESIRYLVRLRNGEGVIDDIDHLGNRRVRSVGELLANQVRIGLVRMQRTIRERMDYQDPETLTPQTLVNPKPVSAVIKDFFGRSQLSHFMDQTNPLAELTHKRRLSALGPGGLSRERAGFEVRDVHPTHYGRICPIETPEGPNIGLMASLSTYARVNEYGFLETPYRKVVNGRVTKQIEYLSAYDEDHHTVAQANAVLDAQGRFREERVLARHRGDFRHVAPGEVEYMDVSPMQLVSVAAALIPFLEHDDANRALMGSNMQRQAVPLLTTEAPLVGTGVEAIAARNSGAVVIARNSGVVKEVDAERIVIERSSTTSREGDLFIEDVDDYRLQKFVRSNQNTCLNQKPVVCEDEKVKAGAVIADGPATHGGELALGRNVLVAFMPWEGYNFEDAVLISERLVKEDMFTSVHIEEFITEARETKLGKEEITRDIPNVSEEALTELDENGIVRIGAEVNPGDILVGRVTPKGESELAPEEKLLRAIFGEKADDVRDTSLIAPPGLSGVVVDVLVLSRKDRAQDRQSKAALEKQVAAIRKEYDDRIRSVHAKCKKLLKELLAGCTVKEDVVDPETDKLVFSKGSKVREKQITEVEYGVLNLLYVTSDSIQKKFEGLLASAVGEEERLATERDSEIEGLKKGDELPPGVLKAVKVYVAKKRRLSVGDKMAGRHGNKGVVAKILPEEDMPFLPDGTPVEMVLNPLGVPSRMNVGQILETHLGWAIRALGLRAASPVFNGATEAQIKGYLKEAGLPENGKAILCDGRTGLPFHQKVTVGYIYMMKLLHLVDDKIHARSIGPYSLVTQQPLGGKAQRGGQRFGEMEVWSLQAYGAAHTLQEMLTIKSDDVAGRTKAYEAIVKGQKELQVGTPESFNVLVKELRGLCLNVRKLVEVEDEMKLGRLEEE